MKDSLEDVINKLHIWKLHRIFIIDKDKKPIGVVGLKEILNEILFN
jgi:predicted transcriptional regulator